MNSCQEGNLCSLKKLAYGDPVEVIRAVGPVAERLRDFVRSHVRKEGMRYEHGAQTVLAKAIGVTPAWVSGYADFPPMRNADIDTAFAICDFYGVSLSDFRTDLGAKTANDLIRHSPDQGSELATPGGSPDARRTVPDTELRALRLRVRYLETTLRRIAQHGTAAGELAAGALSVADSRIARPRRRAGARKPAR